MSDFKPIHTTASEIRRGDVIKFSTAVEDDVIGIVHDVYEGEEEGKLCITMNLKLHFDEGWSYEFFPNKSLTLVGQLHYSVLG